jgi:hypothetical protein
MKLGEKKPERKLAGRVYCNSIRKDAFPFDGLTPLRGEWDEYFLLRVLLNRRETKMSPQTYR